MRHSVVLKTNRSERLFQCSDDSAAVATIESVRMEVALLV